MRHVDDNEVTHGRGIRLPLAILLVIASAARAQMPPARVVVTPVVEQNLASGQVFVATILPVKRATIGSAVSGRVIEVSVEEGDRVEAGQPLVQLLTATISLELQAAEAELRLRSEELRELENGLRPSEIEQAKAKLLGAEADMAYASARAKRAIELQQAKAVSQEEVDKAQAAATMAKQTFYDYKAAYALAIDGPREERIGQARAQVEMQQAIVSRIEDQIKKYTLVSRFDGYVATKHTEEGAWLKTGDPVLEVLALDQVDVQAYVKEQDIPFIKPGMSVRVEVPALPNEMFMGQVAAIIPQADTQARTFPVKIRVDNRKDQFGPVLKSGMFARVELPTGHAEQSMMVPKDALVLGGPKPVVYVVQSEDGKTGTATPIPVELGVATPNLIQVTGALQPGQSVVVEGNERLFPGQEIVIVKVVSPSGNEPDDKPNQG